MVEYSVYISFVFFFQAEDGIRDLVRSRGLGDVYKRQLFVHRGLELSTCQDMLLEKSPRAGFAVTSVQLNRCLLYTSDAADERSSVDLGGRRIIKKKNKEEDGRART